MSSSALRNQSASSLKKETSKNSSKFSGHYFLLPFDEKNLPIGFVHIAKSLFGFGPQLVAAFTDIQFHSGKTRIWKDFLKKKERLGEYFDSSANCAEFSNFVNKTELKV